VSREGLRRLRFSWDRTAAETLDALLEISRAARTSLVNRPRVLAILGLTLGTLLIGGAVAAAPHARGPRILVFTKTAGFRHASIPAGLQALRELGRRNGLGVDATEDSGAFTPANLARYRAVVFLSTTGDVLTGPQQTAFERFIRAGGGFVGVHAAADTEYGWPWYGRLLGARFKNHPQIQRATINVAARRDPSTVGLPRTWIRVDEWYNFQANPRPHVHVLATLDETSYSPGDGAMGADHPIAWSHEFQGGRAWYTAGGHTDESYSEPLFRSHLLEGIRYAAGVTPPRIVGVNSTVSSRRLLVSVRYRSCYPCVGKLELLVRGRRSATPVRFSGQVGRARSALLPRGQWPFSVVLRDPSTGLKNSVRRSVRVR
jgi:type 1 glutamine amidotransferase